MFCATIQLHKWLQLIEVHYIEVINIVYNEITYMLYTSAHTEAIATVISIVMSFKYAWSCIHINIW